MRITHQVIQVFFAAMIFIAPFLCIRFCELHHEMEQATAFTNDLVFLKSLPDSICGDLQNKDAPASSAEHSSGAFLEKLNQMLSLLTQFLPVVAALLVIYIAVGWVFDRGHTLVPHIPKTPRRPPRFA